MPPIEILIAFLATTAIFAVMPGPAMIYAAAQALARGRWGGLMAAFGLHLGGYVHVAAAAAGLSVLFHAVPTLYLVFKLAGAAFLVWRGVAMFLAKPAAEAPRLTVEQKSARRAFVESVIVEILNPKTAIFFVAFLPQFIDPTATFPVWVQFVILGAVVNLMFGAVDVVCVLLAGAVVARAGRSTLWARRAGGATLVGLGVHLGLQRA